ncbi:MAG TPA: hypothetical protein VGQ00_00455 [Candidatus Norongarragalinales archaeon]|jgi:hypothetical protein|nr:hypothetical protein [Candidatus Norongarragalinales archaeon]
MKSSNFGKNGYHGVKVNKFRKDLESLFGPSFKIATKQLGRDGILILPQYFKSDVLSGVQKFFNNQLRKKKIDPFLKQASFNGAVDDAALSTSKPASKAATDPTILALIAHYLGGPVVLSNWRGYRTEKSSPIRYRAWDWHNDQKRKEIKLMMLLTPVSSKGQPMLYVKGSQKHRWKLRTQADSKYSMLTANKLGHAIVECFGPAGTAIIFDTNGVHSGKRSLHEARNVLSFNYTPASGGGSVFPIKSLHPEVLRKRASGLLHWPKAKSTLTNDLKKISNIAQEVKNSIVRTTIIKKEQDLEGNGKLRLIKEFEATPTFDQLKPRFNFKESFRSFISRNANMDFGSDLDLPVRPGDADVDRDIQYVKYRDRNLESAAARRLKKNLQNIDYGSITPSTPTLRIAAAYAKEISITAGVLSRVRNVGFGNALRINLTRIEKLGEDLAAATCWTDSASRLRTNLIYTYAALDDLIDTLEKLGRHNKKFLNKSENLKSKSQKLLEMYVGLVLLDDLCKKKGH